MNYRGTAASGVLILSSEVSYIKLRNPREPMFLTGICKTSENWLHFFGQVYYVGIFFMFFLLCL